jgi:hypothetical protein
MVAVGARGDGDDRDDDLLKSLRGVTQNWDKVLPANNGGEPCRSSRFTCVMGGTAVRDNETGLVWEKAPDTAARAFDAALGHCANREVGGRKGWRLPSFHELASLLDRPSRVGPGSALPPGHPFRDVQVTSTDYYWSATTVSYIPADAWVVTFGLGASADVAGADKTDPSFVWCVRGGSPGPEIY